MLVGVRSAFCSGLSQPKTLDRRNIALARAVIASRRRSNPGGRRTLLDCFAAFAMTAPCLRQRSLENLLSQPRTNLFSSPRRGKMADPSSIGDGHLSVGRCGSSPKGLCGRYLSFWLKKRRRCGLLATRPWRLSGLKEPAEGAACSATGFRAPGGGEPPLRHRGRHLMIITPLRLDTRRPRSGRLEGWGRPRASRRFPRVKPGDRKLLSMRA
jgi:hypothetical protein